MQQTTNQHPFQDNPQGQFLKQFANHLDASGNITKDLEGESPCLTDIQLKAFCKKLLLNIKVIDGLSIPVWRFQRKIQKILHSLEGNECAHRRVPLDNRHTHLKAAGSSIIEDIESDPSYAKDVLHKINPSATIPDSQSCVKNFLDLDFKIKSTLSNKQTNLELKAQLVTWLALKIMKATGKSSDEANRIASAFLSKKFYEPEEEGELGNRFMLLSIGDQTVSVDMVIAQNLRREFLLSTDRCQVPYNIIKVVNPDGSKTIRLTHEAFQKDYKAYGNTTLIRPNLSLLDLAQTLLDRKAKIVHFPNINTLDLMGWYRLIQNFVDGYSAADDESLLVNIVTHPYNLSNFVPRLKSYLEAHFKDDQIGMYFYLLNALTCMHRNGQFYHADVIRGFEKEAYETDWFGEKLDDVKLLTNVLNSVGLLMLGTESKDSAFQVACTFSSGKPALRWTYKTNQKAYSLLVPFDASSCFKDFLALIQEAPLFYSTLLSKRQTKKDPALLVATLKFLKVKEINLIKFIESLESLKTNEAINAARHWSTILKYLQIIPQLKTTEEVTTFVNGLLPLLKLEVVRNEYRSYLQEIFNQSLSLTDPIELYKRLNLFRGWNSTYSWIFIGNEFAELQSNIISRIADLSSDNVNTLKKTFSVIQSDSDKKAFQAKLKNAAYRCMSESLNLSDVSQTYETLKLFRELYFEHSTLFDEEGFNAFQDKMVTRIVDLTISANDLVGFQKVVSVIESTVIKTRFCSQFRRLVDHFMSLSEGRQANADRLVTCLSQCSWLYEDNLEESVGCIVAILNNCSSSEAKKGLAQNHFGYYLKKGTDKHQKVLALLPQLRFNQLPQEVKKGIQPIFKPIITQLYSEQKYKEIIELYRWLGISGTRSVAEVKGVFPAAMNDEFTKILRVYLQEIFYEALHSQTEPKVVYGILNKVSEWHQTYPWIFDSLIDFEEKSFSTIATLVEKDPNRMMVLLKEVASEITQESHKFRFAPHARRMLEHCLVSSGDQLIWNLISINTICENFPWIYSDHAEAHRSLLSKVLSLIATAMDATKPDHRWFNLADLYLRNMMECSGSGLHIAGVMLKPIMRTHAPSKELKLSLQKHVSKVITDLQTNNLFKEIIDLYYWLFLNAIAWEKSQETSAILLHAFSELNDLLFVDERYKAIKQFFIEIQIEENKKPIESISRIFKTILISGRASEAKTLLSSIKGSLPLTHAECAWLCFEHLAQNPKNSLATLSSLVLDAEWKSARARDPAMTEQLSLRLFDLAQETGFTEIRPFDAFRLIKNVTPAPYKRWNYVCEHFDNIKSKTEVEEMWNAFRQIPVPAEGPTRTAYLTRWASGLRRYISLHPDKLNSIPDFYSHVKEVIEQPRESTFRLDVFLSIYRLFAEGCRHQYLSEQSWKLLETIIECHKVIPSNMEIDCINLLATSPSLEYFLASCVRLTGLITPQMSEKVTAAGIKILKESKKFIKANEDSPVHKDVMHHLVNIINVWGNAQQLDETLRQDLYNLFIETGSPRLIKHVLKWLVFKLRYVNGEETDLILHELFVCTLTAKNIITLFNFVTTTEELDVQYRKLARRFLAHPSIIPILKDYPADKMKELWFQEIRARCKPINETHKSADDLLFEVRETQFLKLAPPEFVEDPFVMKYYAELFKQMILSNASNTASAVHSLYAHCGLGSMMYGKKYKFENVAHLFQNACIKKEYLVLNDNSPYFKNPKWAANFVRFLSLCLNQMNAEMVNEKTLDTGQGDYLKSVAEVQVNKMVAILNQHARSISDEIQSQCVDALKSYYMLITVLPKNREQEEKFLNDVFLQIGVMNLLIPDVDLLMRFNPVREMQALMASMYSETRVKRLAFQGRPRNAIILELLRRYTHQSNTQSWLGYIFDILIRLLRDEQNLDPIFVATLHDEIFEFLKKGVGCIKGQSVVALGLFRKLSITIVESLLKNLKDKKCTQEQYNVVIVVITNHIILKWLRLSESIGHNYTSTTDVGLELCLMVEPVIASERLREKVFQFHMLAAITEMVVPDIKACAQSQSWPAIRILALKLLQLKCMTEWKLTDSEMQVRDVCLREYVLHIGRLLFPFNPNHTASLARDLLIKAREHNAFTTFAPEVLKGIENSIRFLKPS